MITENMKDILAKIIMSIVTLFILMICCAFPLYEMILSQGWGILLVLAGIGIGIGVIGWAMNRLDI